MDVGDAKESASADEARAKPHAALRTCVGCGESDLRAHMLRLVADPSGERIVVDWKGALPGRGASLHPRFPCVQRACTRGRIERALRLGARPSVEGQSLDAQALSASLRKGMERRVETMLGRACASAKAVIGFEPGKECVQEGAAQLVILAEDAALRVQEFGRKIAAVFGVPTLSFGRLARLGQLCSRSEVGMITVIDETLAAEIRLSIEGTWQLSEVA